MQQHTVTLDTPIKRGETEITTVTLRKPLGGALRGVSLRELLDMDGGAIMKVVPRLSDPALTDADMAKVDGADLLQMGAVIAGFLLPKAVMAEAEQASNSPTT